MAEYKHPRFLTQTNHASFDIVHAPGKAAPNTGVYRCEECGREIIIGAGLPLPSTAHHPHEPGKRDISWRLVVATSNSREAPLTKSQSDSLIL